MISKPTKRALGGTALALWITAEAALLGNLFHFPHIVEFIEIGLAAFGSVFAILAMRDAHNAFLKAEQVEEAVGSFRMSFQDVMGEMVSMCRNAKHRLSILIPTPGYGYLFGEVEKSQMFVDELENFLGRDGTSLDLFLVVGDQSRPEREIIPQRYLQRAFELQDSPQNDVTALGYIALVRKVFACMSQHAQKTTLTLLKSDPNVRLVLADADDPDHRSCLFSFAQADPDDIAKEFKSTGFKSTHSYMVHAVQDLLTVYSAELCSKREIPHPGYIESLYVTIR